MNKILRESIITDILIENGEIELNEARKAIRSGLSTNFFQWQRRYKGERESSNHGIPFISKTDTDASDVNASATRYAMTDGKLATLHNLEYVAALDKSSDYVYFGVKLKGNARGYASGKKASDTSTGSREQHVMSNFIKEFYSDTTSYADIVMRSIGSPLFYTDFLDSFSDRQVTLEEYEEKLMDYIMVTRFEKKLNAKKINMEKLEKELEEEKRLFRRVNESDDIVGSRPRRRVDIERERQEDWDAYNKENEYEYVDPKNEIVKAKTTEYTKGIRSKKQISIIKKAIEEIVDELIKEWRMRSFEYESYDNNALINMCVIRYGARSIFWKDSFWNAK